MSANALTTARVSHRIAASATTGLFKAMSDQVRRGDPLPTVEVTELAPRTSMFGYDADSAVALTELPERI